MELGLLLEQDPLLELDLSAQTLRELEPLTEMELQLALQFKLQHVC